MYSEKSRSPAVKEATAELLEVVNGLKGSRELVIRAFNATMTNTLALETSVKRVSTEERATDTPCWWEAGPMRPQLERRIPTNKTADRIEQNETSGNTSELEFKVAKSRKRRGKRGTNKVPSEQTAKVDTTAPKTLKAVQGKHRWPPRTQAVVQRSRVTNPMPIP